MDTSTFCSLCTRFLLRNDFNQSEFAFACGVDGAHFSSVAWPIKKLAECFCRTRVEGAQLTTV